MPGTEPVVLPEVNHFRGKVGQRKFEMLRRVLKRNADGFSKLKSDIGCCEVFEHEIELEEGAVSHRSR